MNKSSFGNHFTVMTWGESHGKALGAVIVGMTRAVGVSKISIIPGTLVCVAYHERDRSSGGFSLKNSGEDFYQIPFLAGSCITTLPGFTPVEKSLLL